MRVLKEIPANVGSSSKEMSSSVSLVEEKSVESQVNPNQTHYAVCIPGRGMFCCLPF